MKVVIIGGNAGGASCAARLRRLDEMAEIVVFEKGEYISYASCGLPYYIGGEIANKDDLTLQTPYGFKRRFNVDVRVNSEVIKIDKESKTVTVKNKLASDEYNEYTEKYDYLVISVGAEPIIPDILSDVGKDRLFTLRTVSDTFKLKEYISKNSPKSAVIIGGGNIGIEVAENLKNIGINVIIIEKSKQVLNQIDYDMACEVHGYLRKKGIKLYLDSEITNTTENDSSLKISFNDTETEADIIITAIGVKPDTILASECGIETNSRGAIITDDKLLTSDNSVYAVGDAIQVKNFVTTEQGIIPLAGPANKQGRIAADNISGLDSVYKGTQGSSITKIFDMVVASTGINEKDVLRLNISYEKSFIVSASNAGYYPGGMGMSIKTIFSPDNGKLLGAQIVGFKGVDKRIDVFATAIRAGFTVFDLAELELCYAPPFSSAKDPVNMAGYVAENIVTEKVKVFHWHDVDTLPRDGSITLIDTRTPTEYMRGHIDGFINLQLDELRDNFSELDKNKPIYIHCQSGLRSYIAARILSQNGFDVYNLSGGYRLYSIIKSNQ